MSNFAIIGLGNPGKAYLNTRHNLGFWLIDAIAESQNLTFKSSKGFHADYSIMNRKNNRLLLIKPTTFMNESGKHLSVMMSYFKCLSENVILVHDELTLPFGEIKVSQKKGSGGHNGVASVMNAIGNSFVRFRIGIGSKSNEQMKLSDFVLSKLGVNECNHLNSIKKNLVETLFGLIDDGVVPTMNLINQKHPS